MTAENVLKLPPRPTPITPELREQLRERLDYLNSARRAVEQAAAPFRQAAEAIDHAATLLTEHLGVEIEGTCECGVLILKGDKHHPCSDGPDLCEACAPDWAAIAKQWDETERQEDFPEGYRLFQHALQVHLAAGGKLEDKVLYVA